MCNLYPFEATVTRGADFETTIENIDIGGPAMTRSAAKNHDWITVVVDVEDYAAVLDEVLRAKPSAAKGTYLKKVTVTTTMGPGVQVDPKVTKGIRDEVQD